LPVLRDNFQKIRCPIIFIMQIGSQNFLKPLYKMILKNLEPEIF